MAKRKTRLGTRQRAGGARAKSPKRKPIESYDHKGKKRVNNPSVGLVTPDTNPDAGQKKTYQYDAHLDPQLA